MLIELAPFRDNLLEEAATLLAARHRRDRRVFPELPAQFEEPAQAYRAIEALWRRPMVGGMAALAGGRLVGYVIGEVTVDTLRGRSAWVRLAGHALDPAQPVELYRDLYAAVAPQWLAWGCFDHYVLALAAEQELLEAWFALGFGYEQAHALRPLTERDREPGDPSEGLTLRRARVEDRELLRGIAHWTAQHQAQAPVWAPMPPEYLAEIQASYAEMVDEAGALIWLALRENQPVGFQAYFPAEAGQAELITPEKCLELSAASTQPEERGRGVGQALTRRGLAEAYAQEYAYCLTDWRVTNLLASRFWPRQGFRPVAYRLARKIDERVLWASGKI